ncbi:MAG: acetylglutamate kinase [Bacteroidetes bacterium]|nr:acetylglutamate kinase [Bacteroidota bacterium]HET6243957.1 acetylglutamate kinase [Bacteroidia bacterium]
MKKKKLYIIAIGGNILDDQDRLNNFLLDFSQIRTNKILVHEGGVMVNEICKKLGVDPEKSHGKKSLDQNASKISAMVYAGLINKSIVARLQANQCNAIGLSGVDANIIPAVKIEENKEGYVDSETINVSVIAALIENCLIPVIAPISHDGNGNFKNLDPDNVASELAVAFTNLYDVHLIYCFEKKGILKDISDNNSVIPKITLENYNHLKKDGVIAEGMTPKLDKAFSALKRKVLSVRICSVDKLLNTVNSPERVGTELYV